MSTKELLFSFSIKDCEMQTFRSGGKGGQNQNKVNSGVRLIHHASGARGEARDSRDQLQNKRNAFLRLVESKEWRRWHRAEVSRLLGHSEAARAYVEETTQPQYLRVEGLTEEGWKPIEE